MDNARRLQDGGLSHRGLVALLVIAEGCRDEGRRGRVPRARVAAVLGATERTATRAIKEVVTAGHARVLQPARRRESALAANGTAIPRGLATLYELAPLGSWDDTQVSPQSQSREDTQVSPQVGIGETNPNRWGDKSERLGRHLGVSLPVVSPVGESRGEREAVLKANLGEAEKPPLHCPKHPNGTESPCRACGDARQMRASWEAKQARQSAEARSREARERAEVRASEIARCDLCSENGYVGTVLCDHDPETPERARRGIALVRAALAERSNTR
jgi:hypothetical protein